MLDETNGIRIVRYPFRKLRNILGILQPLLEKEAIDRNLAKLLKEALILMRVQSQANLYQFSKKKVMKYSQLA